ncbi:tail fiber hinge connector [Klebsiella phage Metamorpho]|nr:tail fiber hinge connector [Klebsiella phage Metamorpho]
MADPILMAAFGEDFVETRILSEANSVTYWLRAYATHKNSVPNESVLTINGSSANSPALRRGINVIQVNNDGTFGELKNFDVTNEESANNNAFLDYTGNLRSGLFVIMTHESYKTSPKIDTWFGLKNSIQWQNSEFAKNYPNCAYVGILAAGKNRIVAESFYANDGVLKEDSRAKLDNVFDNVGDVGYVGMPFRTIEDITEYSDTTGYEYKRYPEQNVVISKIAPYGLSPGDSAVFICDLYASKALLDSNSTTRANIRWFKGTTMLDSSAALEVPKNMPDRWVRFERWLKVPTGADGFTVVVSRYPRTTVTAESKIRNVFMSQVSHEEQLNTVTQEFGVNGIRMNKAVDGGTTHIFELPNAKVDPSGIISAKTFRETQD